MLDVYINKPFKCNMRAEYLKWMDDGTAEFTKSGNRKRASYEEVVRWVTSSWQKIDAQQVRTVQ